jgi:hypothetical protein
MPIEDFRYYLIHGRLDPIIQWDEFWAHLPDGTSGRISRIPEMTTPRLVPNEWIAIRQLYLQFVQQITLVALSHTINRTTY